MSSSRSEPNDIDQIYRVLKQAGELSADKSNTNATLASGNITAGKSYHPSY